MQARPDDAFLRELREKLDPELEMQLDQRTNEVVVRAPGGSTPIARVAVDPLQIRTERSVLEDPERSHVDVSHPKPLDVCIARLTERPLRIEIEPGLVAETNGDEVELYPELHAKARQVLAEMVAPWEARGYRTRTDRRSRGGVWLGSFDKRPASVDALVDEVLFAAGEEMTVMLEDWDSPPPSAKLVGAFNEAFSAGCDVFRADRRLMVRNRSSGQAVSVLDDPVRIECRLWLGELRPDLPSSLLEEPRFHEELPFVRERGYEHRYVPYDPENMDPPSLRVLRAMDSIPSAVDETRWLFENDLPVRW